MNRRARAARAQRHALREPDRPRRPRATTRRARDLVKLAQRPAPQPVLPQDRQPPRGDAEDRRPPAHDRQPQQLVRRYRWIDGVKTGHTQQAGYVLVGAGAPQRRAAVSRRARRRRARRARDADSLALLRYGLRALPTRSPIARGPRPGPAPDQVPPTAATLQLVAGAHACARSCAQRRARRGHASSTRPREVEGPLRARPAARAVESSSRGAARSRRVPLVTASAVTEAVLGRAQPVLVAQPGGSSILRRGARGGSASGPAAAAPAPGRRRRRGREESRETA